MSQPLITSTELSQFLPAVVSSQQQQGFAAARRESLGEERGAEGFKLEEPEDDRFEARDFRRETIETPDYATLGQRFGRQQNPAQDYNSNQNQTPGKREETIRGNPPGFSSFVSAVYETSREVVFRPPNPGGNLDLVT